MTIRFTVDGDVAELLIDRPQVRNGLDLQTLHELSDALRDVPDTTAKALVFGGVGKYFCVGADLTTIDTTPGAGPDAEMLTVSVELLKRMHALPMPVVAAVEGFAAGGGAGFALAADMRVFGRSAKLLAATLRLGMTPDAGVSYYLTRSLGRARATSVILRNEHLDAATLEGYGLVDLVVDDGNALANAHELAASLALTTPPLAIVGLRDLIDQASTNTLDEQLDAEAGWVGRLRDTADFTEGITAFFERRSPLFVGR